MDPLYTLVAAGDSTRRTLLRHLRPISCVTVVGECDSALNVTRALRTRAVHLLVLDAALPPDGGRAALDRLGEDTPPAVVIAAAEDGDGLWAYALGAVDCLPPALDTGRMQTAVERARDRVLQTEIRTHRDQLLTLLNGAGISGPSDGGAHRPLVVRSGSQLLFLDPEEIDWVEAAGVYVNVHVGKTTHLLRETLRHIEEQLDSNRFVRVHRSTIINVDRVRKIVPHLNGGAVVVLKDGKQLKMSRSYREQIHATLG